MADGPWRCSECGTINEPVANSCRTCGKWPSLFDLQESVVDEAQLPPHLETATAEPGTFDPPPFEPQTFETEHVPVPETHDAPEPDLELEPETPADRRRRLLTSLIIPLAFVVYIVISVIFGDRGSG